MKSFFLSPNTFLPHIQLRYASNVIINYKFSQAVNIRIQIWTLCTVDKYKTEIGIKFEGCIHLFQLELCTVEKFFEFHFSCCRFSFTRSFGVPIKIDWETTNEKLLRTYFLQTWTQLMQLHFVKMLKAQFIHFRTETTID